MQRPSGIGAFQFVILSSLRAVQLTRGCIPRVEGAHKKTVIAQLEVSLGLVTQLTPIVPAEQLIPAILV
jgi:DNA-directed RNA polymerase subunit K/omega